MLEYLQQITGKLPAGVNPMIGPDATGAGWVYEYALVDKSHTHSLADLRSLQDWNVRYALETVPGVSEVATIGGFVKQYQVKLDPNRLLALKSRWRRSSTRFATATAKSAGACWRCRERTT